MLEPSELHTLVDFGMCVVLWLVQLVIYPSFLRIADSELISWHKAYTFRVSFMIIPLMFAQLGFALVQAWQFGDLRSLLVLGLVLICWFLTFFVSVPLHNRLAGGELDPDVRRKLIRTNWPRTFLWSLICLLGVGR